MNAYKQSVKIDFYSTNPEYDLNARKFQGISTIAVTKGGRIFIGWCSGGNSEPRIENYKILSYSDDQGKTWCKPIMIIPSEKENLIQVQEIEIYITPDGALHVQWSQHDVKIATEKDVNAYSPENPVTVAEGYVFDDLRHATWEMVCDNPDADVLEFGPPEYIYDGIMRCKPTYLSTGEWVAFAYDQLSDRYAYNISYDKGKTWKRMHGSKKLLTPFDEGMAYETKDGTVRYFVRNEYGYIGETDSRDGCKTWTEAFNSGIISPSTRFFISRTPSGKVLLVHNDHEKVRTNMTVRLSEDDGKTWAYSLCVDDRNDISYPDVDFCGDKIYLTYDRERRGAKEVLLTIFTEQDIIDGNKPEILIVSKPGLTEV